MGRIRRCWRVLKALLTALAIIVIVGVSVGLVYFLTLTIGWAILILLIFIGVKEYYRDEPEIKDPPE